MYNKLRNIDIYINSRSRQNSLVILLIDCRPCIYIHTHTHTHTHTHAYTHNTTHTHSSHVKCTLLEVVMYIFALNIALRCCTVYSVCSAAHSTLCSVVACAATISHAILIVYIDQGEEEEEQEEEDGERRGETIITM